MRSFTPSSLPHESSSHRRPAPAATATTGPAPPPELPPLDPPELPPLDPPELPPLDPPELPPLDPPELPPLDPDCPVLAWHVASVPVTVHETIGKTAAGTVAVAGVVNDAGTV